MASTELSGWSHIPGDLLILVAENSTLEDALIIPQASTWRVCRAFRQTFQDRITWITMLKAYRDRNCGPLDCPAHDDLSTRSLDDLKHLANLALRVQRGIGSYPLQKDNQDLPILALTAMPPTFRCPTDEFVLGLIPGTDFGLIMSPTRVSCWDMVRGNPISSVELGLGERFVPSETGICEAAGRWLTVLESDKENTNDVHSVIVLAVNHGVNFDSPVISVAFRRNDIPCEPSEVALNSEMLAIIIPTQDANPVISILAFDFLSGREHTISTNIDILRDGLFVAQFIEDVLYIIENADDHHAFYHLPRQFFPYADNSTPCAHLDDSSKQIMPRNPEVTRTLHRICESFVISPVNIIVEAIETWDRYISVLLNEYEMGPKIQARHVCITLPPNLVYDYESESVMIYASWKTMVFYLLDTNKEEGKQGTYYLMQYDSQKLSPNHSFVELQFPAEIKPQGINVIDIEINAGKGEILVAIEQENNVLSRLSYSQ
ncbi:hypothetical protein C8J56DRAFT_36704 [Mycena floridula]|nr:hypothetical protein C8J56DRAFT_36704 [Mycena floridula]